MASCAASRELNILSGGEGGDAGSIAVDDDQLDALVDCRQCAVDSVDESSRMNYRQEDGRLSRFARRPEVTWGRCACSSQTQELRGT